MPGPRRANEVVVLTAEQMRRTITRIAHEVLEKNPGDAKLAVVGIHTRGAFLGERIHKLLCQVGGRSYDKGDLDISFYGDDVAARGARSDEYEIRTTALRKGVPSITTLAGASAAASAIEAARRPRVQVHCLQDLHRATEDE